MVAKLKKHKGFTTVELIVVIAITGILAGTFIVTWMGARETDEIDRAAQNIYDDLVYLRSLAVSTNKTYRINFTAAGQWKLERYDEATTSWSQIDSTRNMKTGISLTSSSFSNAASNLEATPRGLYDFQNSATGDPYVTVQANSSSKTKSVLVAVGGALEFETN